MKTVLHWSPRAALLAVMACDGLTFVEPRPVPAAMAINLQALIDESSRYQLNAVFRRGVDARGDPIEVIDGALYVEGTAISPDAETTPGIWSYRWQEDRPTTGDQRDAVRVVFPVVATSPPAHSMMIPITARDGSPDVDLARGEDLVLRVSLPGGSAPPAFGGVEFWRLEIRPSCSSGDGTPQLPQFTISGNGAFPSELRVHSRWLDALPVGSTSACFQAFSSYPVVGAPYLISVGVGVRIAWRIRVVDPTS